MNEKHRLAREWLKRLSRPRAKEMLKDLLPEREYQAIYYCDFEDWPRWKVGKEIINCEVSQVSRIKGRGYERLSEEINKQGTFPRHFKSTFRPL